jgi:deoxyribodipyrimidine photo-lyase
MSPSSTRRVAVAILRQDLRIHDNAVLLAAHQAGTHLLPIYIYDERHVELSGLPNYVRQGPEARTRICKFWRTSVFRARFMTEGVYDVKQRLQQRGSDMLIRFGKLEEVVDEVVGCLKEGGDEVVGVWLQKDFCSEEIVIENKLRKRLNKHGVKFELPNVQTLSKSSPVAIKLTSLPR